MTITLRDVAGQAGVSIGTASLALNNDKRVSVRTAERVRRIARELGYVPNVQGRALRSRCTKVIGLVVDVITSSFYFEVIRTVKARVEADGYTVILGSCEHISSKYYSEELQRYINAFRGGLVDGAIFAPGIGGDTEAGRMVAELVQDRVPIVFIDLRGPQYGSIPLMKPDMQMAGQKATEYLVELGHSRIAFAGVPGEDRMSGYVRAMSSHGLPIADSLILSRGDSGVVNTLEGGLRVGSQVASMAEPPTAVVCFTDEVAMGVIQSLAARGIAVPDQISVVGIDDIDVAALYNPPLTTVDIQKEQMAMDAADTLLRMIRGEEIPAGELVKRYSVSLVIRKSAALTKN